MGQTVIEDGVARAEEKTEGGDVGGMPADIGDGVFHFIEIGDGAFQNAVGRTLAAHKAAGPGGRAVAQGGLVYGCGNLGMGVEIEVVVGGKIDVFLAVNMRRGLGCAVVAQKKRVFHAHFRAHFHKPFKRQFGAHAEDALRALPGGCMLRSRCVRRGLFGRVFLHANLAKDNRKT